ncbi:hypothetical protein NLI96_g7198 [Meripilus lineatus]|uniref:Uncharacterized protein n=1 Tax=Meripilus lineatus TaxID=2056292 RepID=A0AAD5YD61_9APHY|nr:hypothetical protein NLI96_g7198 [Physisporinus lineatus]
MSNQAPPHQPLPRHPNNFFTFRPLCEAVYDIMGLAIGDRQMVSKEVAKVWKYLPSEIRDLKFKADAKQERARLQYAGTETQNRAQTSIVPFTAPKTRSGPGKGQHLYLLAQRHTYHESGVFEEAAVERVDSGICSESNTTTHELARGFITDDLPGRTSAGFPMDGVSIASLALPRTSMVASEYGCSDPQDRYTDKALPPLIPSSEAVAGIDTSEPQSLEGILNWLNEGCIDPLSALTLSLDGGHALCRSPELEEVNLPGDGYENGLRLLTDAM